MNENITKATEDDKWTGRIYRDNDSRFKGTRMIDVLEEPDESGRVRVLAQGGRNKVKVQSKRLLSSAYTRLPELEK